MWQSALPAVGLLVLMVLLAFALQRWKRHLPGVAQQTGPVLKVMNSMSLGPQQRLVTVQVGQGADALCLVLGVAPGSVNTLHSLPLPAAPVEDTPAESAMGFSARLSQLMNPSATPKGNHAPQ